VAFVQGLLQMALRSAIEVAEHFGTLQEVAVLNHFDELGTLDEVVVHAVHLARAHGTGGVGDRDANLLVSVGQGLDQAALARARRGGNDVKGAGAVGHVGCLTQYSVLVRAFARSTL